MSSRRIGHEEMPLKQRLSEHLSRIAMGDVDTAITVVHGAPRAGKSVALLEAERTSDRFVVVRLTDHDVSLFGFVRAIAHALARYVRGPSQSFAALHERLATAEDPIPSLVRWMLAHLDDQRITIAIDRFERISDDERIGAFIEGVARAGRGVRWVLATRTMGALPVDSWMARALMSMPHELLAPGDSIEATIVLDALLPKHRRLIEATAELPALDATLLAALGIENASETLRSLHNAYPDLFEAGDVLEYRYDVRTAAIDRLRRDDVPRYVEIVRATGDVLERERRFEDALRLYIRTMQIEPLYRLLERYGLEVWETVSPDTLDVALRLVPRESQPESGIVLALRAAAASRAGRYDISETLYMNAIEISQGDVRARIAYTYGCDLLRRNRSDAIDVLRPLVTEGMDPLREAAVRSALAQAYCMRDDAARANAEAAAALALCATTNDTWMAALVHTRAAYVRFYAENDLHGAHTLATHGLSLADSARAYVTAIGALSILYNVACEYDDPVMAIANLRKLAEHSAKIGNVSFASYALLAELEFQTEAYDLAAVARARETLRSFDVHYESQAASEALLPSDALQLTWRGEFERAYRILEPSVAQQQGEDFRALRAAQVALYAAASDALEISAARVEEALGLLSRLDIDAHKCVRARIFVATALSILGQVELADHVFDDVAAGIERYPRLQSIANVAKLVHRLWNGDSVGSELQAALVAASEARYGGLAAMFARLPMKIAVRERVASSARAATAQYAKIVPLLERYHDVPISI